MEAEVHFLIVDDDPALRSLLRLVLGEDGRSRSIREAPDGMQALDVLRASTVPLIVLLDWQMPWLDGGGVLRAVAAEPRLAMMHHFVLVTGADMTAIDVAGDCEINTLLRDLQVPVIRKPFDLTTVFAVVDDIIADVIAR